MLQKLKHHPSTRGDSLDKYLAQRHTSGEWKTSGNDLVFIEKTTGLPVKYKWTVTGTEVQAANGHAAKATPDLYRKSEIVDERRTKLNPEELDLYDFVSLQFGMHGDMLLALKEAAFRYEVTPEQAKEIYLRTDEQLYS